MAEPATEALRAYLAPRLRARREARGLTQQELADKAGIGRAVVCNVEYGRALPSLTAWLALCIALDVDPGPLLREPKCATCGDAPPPGFACLTCDMRTGGTDG